MKVIKARYINCLNLIAAVVARVCLGKFVTVYYTNFLFRIESLVFSHSLIGISTFIKSCDVQFNSFKVELELAHLKRQGQNTFFYNHLLVVSVYLRLLFSSVISIGLVNWGSAHHV